MDHKKLWKILQEAGIPDHLTCLLRNLYEVKKQQLELDMEQQTGSKLGKEYVKAVYCHPAYLLKCRVKVKSLSCIRLFATPWTVAYRASLSMGFSRQGYWSGLPCRVHHVKCQAG